MAPLARDCACGLQADAELVRLQKARRNALKGGIVLSLDPKVGDFASGDVLIEDGKIREVRPEHRRLRRRGRDCRCVEPNPDPRLCRHPQPFLPGAAAKLAAQRPGRSRLQPRRPEQVDARLHAGRCLCRRADHRARLHRHGHDRDHRSLPDQPHARAQRRLHQGVAGCRHPRGLRLFARRRGGDAMAAGHRAPAEDLFQLEGPAADARARREPRCEGARRGARSGRARGHALSGQSCAGARARQGRRPARGRPVHPLHASQRRSLADDQGHRRPHLDVAAARDGDGARHALGPGRARPRHPAVAELRSRHHGRPGLLLDDAHDLQPAAAAESCSAGETARRTRRRWSPAATFSTSRRCRARAAPISTARSARSRPARRPTS